MEEVDSFTKTERENLASFPVLIVITTMTTQTSLLSLWGTPPSKQTPADNGKKHKSPPTIQRDTIFGKEAHIFIQHCLRSKRKDTHFFAILDTQPAHRAYTWFVRSMPLKNERYWRRLADEFQLIEQKGFWEVFQQVRDILAWMGTNMPHVIRGSSGSSLTCYLMGITDFDPIEHNISLARFMHELREDIPDIDIDVPAHLRLGLYRRIFKEWRGRVARISNHLFFREKSALREAIRRQGHRKRVPRDIDLAAIFPEPKIQQEVAEMAHDLLGSFRGYSLHCGGIVVFPHEVPQKYYLGTWDMGEHQWGPQIHLNKDEVEEENLIKIDILSNRGLSQVFELCPDKPLADYTFHDERVWNLFAKGDVLGITYAETPAMRKVYMALRPRSLADLALGLALIRPAASGRGQKASFLSARTGIPYLRQNTTASNTDKRGGEDGDGDDEECPFPPEERPWLIYDDDAIQWISRWISCGEAVADKYRKAFAKGKRAKQLEFAAKLRRLHPEWTEKQHSWVLSQLAQLQEYSFCKSHAYSYAQLVYVLAYWKLTNPCRFWWATLTHCQSSYKRWVHIREGIRAGLRGGGGRGPWNLREDGFTLQPKEMVQTRFVREGESRDWIDYCRDGAWWGTQFLPGLYERWEENPKKKGEKLLYFRGLVATGRVYVPDRRFVKPASTRVEGLREETSGENYHHSRWITFITLGTENGVYRDLVLWGCYSVKKIHCLEGWGDWVEQPDGTAWCQVRKVKVCALSQMPPVEPNPSPPRTVSRSSGTSTDSGV